MDFVKVNTEESTEEELINSIFKIKPNNLKVTHIKTLGKYKSDKICLFLQEIFNENLDIDIKREIVSSIGRQNNNKFIKEFIEKELENELPMELIYQMYRTCLYKSNDTEFVELGNKIQCKYDNEVINKMKSYYDFKRNRKKLKNNFKENKPLLLMGDSEKTLKKLKDQSVNLIFTSPPYYNAREYSDYHSYKEYLEKMKRVFKECYRVLEDGRFIILNVSPVITKRPGREFESTRYPIPYDIHQILTECGYYFIDEIIWIKPEPSVPNRIGGYTQTRQPLTYKPNCITESIMVYRKDSPFLLDRNVKNYKQFNKFEKESIDTTNCWYIPPKSSKEHPAVFPEELCRRILKYYSFEGDTVLDPFAGSGTFGRVANKMNCIPIMGELNKNYIELIKKDEVDYMVI